VLQVELSSELDLCAALHFQAFSSPDISWRGTKKYDVAMKIDRFEAVGTRGEACIIVRTEDEGDGLTKRYRYALATGERLRPTTQAGVFETFDGKRQFNLRDPSQL
jgi:hypothetical protein